MGIVNSLLGLPKENGANERIGLKPQLVLALRFGGRIRSIAPIGRSPDESALRRKSEDSPASGAYCILTDSADNTRRTVSLFLDSETCAH